jgi:hypothetical protein
LTTLLSCEGIDRPAVSYAMDADRFEIVLPIPGNRYGSSHAFVEETYFLRTSDQLVDSPFGQCTEAASSDMAPFCKRDGTIFRLNGR